MSLSRSRAIAPFAALLLACTPHPTTSAPAIDTLAGGIVRVRNAGPSAWPDTAGWRLVRELVIQPAEESDAAFGREGMLVADEGSGDIYVLDRGPAVIKRFDRTGKLLGVIGREGAGPGEFRDMGNLYLVDTFLVHHDFMLGRFSVFTREGTFVRTMPSASKIGIQLRADERGRMPVMILVPTAAGSEQTGYARYQVGGTIADTLWEPERPSTGWWEVQRGRISGAHRIPFTATGGSTIDRAGNVVWGDGTAGRFLVSRTGRDTARIVEASFPTTAVSDEERTRAFDSLTAKHAWLVGTADLSDIPSTRESWDLLEVSGTGDLWVRRPIGPGQWCWSVFDADGRWLGDVPAPFGEVTASYWGRERVYLLTEDAAGIPRVEVWRIDTTRP